MRRACWRRRRRQEKSTIWLHIPSFYFYSDLDIGTYWSTSSPKTAKEYIYHQNMDSEHFDNLMFLSQRRLNIAHCTNGRRQSSLWNGGGRRVAHSFIFQVFSTVCAALCSALPRSTVSAAQSAARSNFLPPWATPDQPRRQDDPCWRVPHHHSCNEEHHRHHLQRPH